MKQWTLARWLKRAAGRARGAALGSAVVALGCAGGSFEKATAAYATATKESADAFAPAFDTASSLCRTRARLDYLQHRLEGAATEADTWGRWYEQSKRPGVDGGVATWKEQCDMLASSDEMLAQGISALTSYAEALSAVAVAGSYDGQSLADLVTHSAELGEKLARDNTTTKEHTKLVKDLAGPIGAMGAWIVKPYVRSQLKQAILAGAAPSSSILESMARYNAALGIELDDAERRLAGVLDTADTLNARADAIRAAEHEAVMTEYAAHAREYAGRLASDPSADPVDVARAKERAELAIREAKFAEMKGRLPRGDAMRMLELFRISDAQEREIEDIRRAHAAYQGALTKLARAQTKLVDAARGAEGDADALREVLAIYYDVMTQLKTVKDAFAARKGQ